MSIYKTFAKIYDEVMDTDLYEDWLAFTSRHINSDSPQRILELACGTGVLSVELANIGHKVTGLDLSMDMIELAKQRTSEDDPSLSFEQGDMLKLNKNEEYDVVTCYSDSICYMPNINAVKTVFSEVYKSLNTSGVFIFDVHAIGQIEDGFEEYSYHYQTEEFAFLWESYPGDHQYSVEHCLTFFIKQTDGSFKRYDELHEERTYEIDVYHSVLNQVGFKSIECYADFEDREPNSESKRWFFVCKK